MPTTCTPTPARDPREERRPACLPPLRLRLGPVLAASVHPGEPAAAGKQLGARPAANSRGKQIVTAAQWLVGKRLKATPKVTRRAARDPTNAIRIHHGDSGLPGT